MALAYTPGMVLRLCMRVPANLQATAEANTSHAWFTGK